MSEYKERKRAKRIFKRLKVGLSRFEDLSNDEIRLLKKYYPFLFK